MKNKKHLKWLISLTAVSSVGIGCIVPSVLNNSQDINNQIPPLRTFLMK